MASTQPPLYLTFAKILSIVCWKNNKGFEHSLGNTLINLTPNYKIQRETNYFFNKYLSQKQLRLATASLYKLIMYRNYKMSITYSTKSHQGQL